MSESIAEMVVPGTFIEVRAEGLIAVGAIATGNVGVVGTAAKGVAGAVVALGSYADAIDAFAEYDTLAAAAAATPARTPLTLTRALQQVYAGGARNVFAVRIANGTVATASLPIPRDTTGPSFTITAKEPGTYGNTIVADLVDEGTTAAPSFKLTLTYRRVRETFTGADSPALREALGGSRLVDVTAVGGGSTGLAPVSAPLAGGTDLPTVTSLDVAAGLAALEDQPVNIVVVAGLGANTVGGVVGAHLGRTLDAGRERIAILGARDSGTASAAPNVITDAALGSDRIAVVAPGIRTTDLDGASIVLPPSALAAVVAGRLSTLAPHVSLTNKVLPLDGLDVNYSSALLQNLLQSHVLLVRRKFGFQVVKAITTDPGPFTQISVRRTVDFAKAGVRSGADPYIGRLNNARVRAALQATLDGFLSQMVLDEMLTGYALEVTATRDQEIRGVCQVIMTLKPTFSIDFIRVTMNLE
jgi:hypothetical protein